MEIWIDAKEWGIRELDRRYNTRIKGVRKEEQ